MTQALKDKWIEALLSGKYRKCKGELSDGHGRYCALGVLAKVAGIDIKKGGDDYSEIDRVLSPMPADAIYQLNDSGDGEGSPYSFRKLANWIESNVQVTP